MLTSRFDTAYTTTLSSRFYTAHTTTLPSRFDTTYTTTLPSCFDTTLFDIWIRFYWLLHLDDGLMSLVCTSHDVGYGFEVMQFLFGMTLNASRFETALQLHCQVVLIGHIQLHCRVVIRHSLTLWVQLYIDYCTWMMGRCRWLGPAMMSSMALMWCSFCSRCLHSFRTTTPPRRLDRTETTHNKTASQV